jgi:hypothetical protein
MTGTGHEPTTPATGAGGGSHAGPGDGRPAAEPIVSAARRWWLRQILIAAVVVALIVTCGAYLTARRHGVNPADSASPAPQPSTVDGLLAAQTAALLAGDEDAWIGMVDPARPDLRAWYRSVYTSLRVLQVNYFDQVVLTGSVGGPTHSTRVLLRYCLAVARCDRYSDHAIADLHLRLRQDGDRWWITEVAELVDGWAKSRPPPWLPQPLHIRTTGRVIVAAPPALAALVDTVLPVADRAATAVDRYTRPTARPERYVIYLAGPTEQKLWYGLGPAAILDPRKQNYLGMAMHLSSAQIDVILPADRLENADYPLVLRHEMGHVLTQLGEPDEPTYQDTFPGWASEGIAEYIGWTGQPPAAYDRLPTIRRYTAARRWNGTLPVNIDYRDRLGASATYGLNYLLLRHLADQYGELAMLAFIDRVLRNGTSPESAALATFGQPWTTLTTRAATAIKPTVAASTR